MEPRLAEHALRLIVSEPEVETTTDAFAEHLRSEGLAENTVSAYLSDVRQYGVDDNDVFDNPDAHREVAVRIIHSGSAPRTRQRHLSALAKFFDFSLPAEAAANPYRKVKRPTLGVVLPQVVPVPEESRRVIAVLRERGTASSLMYAAAVALMAGAGLRVGEVCSLRPRDLDLDIRVVRVEGKGRKTRDVPLSEFVVDVLRAYPPARLTDAPTQATARLFPVTARSVQRAIRRAAVQAGVNPRLHPHAFRHGFGTAVQEAHGDIVLTAGLLGHAHVDTATIYTHLADTRRASAVEAAL